MSMHFDHMNPAGAAECLAARQTLELAAPGQSDGKVEQAQQHVQECPACRDVTALHERIDLRVRQVCRDVEIPAGLKERLHGALGIEPAPTEGTRATVTLANPANSPAATTGLPGRRRAWLRTVAATAACLMLCAGVAWVWHKTTAATVNLDELSRHVLEIVPEIDELPPFKGFASDTALRLPQTMNTRSLVSPPKELVFGRQRVAVYSFSLPSRPRVPAVQGLLIVVPAAAVADLPAANAFLAGGPNYRWPGFCSTSWVEGELAFICCTTGGEVNLQRLIPPRPVSA